MIPDEAELFTADEVIELELYDAIKRGETEFVGRYKCTKNKPFEFKQQTFIFTDKHGNLRIGKFIDNDELIAFMNYVMEREDKENV